MLVDKIWERALFEYEAIELFIITFIHQKAPQSHPSNRTCQNSELVCSYLTEDQAIRPYSKCETECKRTGETSFVNLPKWFRNGLKWSCFVCSHQCCQQLHKQQWVRDQRVKRKKTHSYSTWMISTTAAAATSAMTIHLLSCRFSL